MKEFKLNSNLNDQVEFVIYDAMNIYVSRLMSRYFELGLEATFQLHFSRILEDMLSVKTISEDERYQVLLEKNIPIDGNKDYVDIVIKHNIGRAEDLYLLELKYKKITDSASDLGNVASYIDMYNLDRHKNTSNVKGCYFIFLTDLKTYVNIPNKGTRMELPMHDLCKIEKNKNYNVTGKAAIDAMGKYHEEGFTFSSDHTIEYTNFKIGDKDFWYFIEKL